MSAPALRALPEDVIHRIAAGEVVARPASVLKELLENALDAGAKEISVSLCNGGLTSLEVEDDGAGIAAEDLLLAVAPHTTSKLAHDRELYDLETYGFRGEALASIAAVSRLTLTSRRHDAEWGSRLKVLGGTKASQEPIAASPGTIVRIEDLFFNTPARRKFIKSPATEQAHLVDTALRVMLGVDHVTFWMRQEGRVLVHLPAGDDMLKRHLQGVGVQIKKLYPFKQSTQKPWVSVHGWVTDPNLHRGDTRSFWLFVNGRAVRDRLLQRGVLEVYRRWIPSGRYPTALIHLKVSRAMVDINVHPQKSEVRFAQSSAVFQAVSSMMADVLADEPWATDEKKTPASTSKPISTLPDAVDAVPKDIPSTQAPQRPYLGIELERELVPAAWEQTVVWDDAVPHPPQVSQLPEGVSSSFRVWGSHTGIELPHALWLVPCELIGRWLLCAKCLQAACLKKTSLPSQKLLLPWLGFFSDLNEDCRAVLLQNNLAAAAAGRLLAWFGFALQQSGEDRLMLLSHPDGLAAKDAGPAAIALLSKILPLLNPSQEKIETLWTSSNDLLGYDWASLQPILMHLATYVQSDAQLGCSDMEILKAWSLGLMGCDTELKKQLQVLNLDRARWFALAPIFFRSWDGLWEDGEIIQVKKPGVAAC